MRVAVFVLALIGGIIGLLGTVLGMGVAGALASAGANQTEMSNDALQLLLGFVLAIAMIVAGSLVLTNHSGRRWGAVLIVASVVGSLAAGGFFMFGGLLGLVGGILSLFIRQPQTIGSPTA